MLGSFLSCGLQLALGFLQFVQAQESGKPEAPTPKKLEVPISLPRDSSARSRPWGTPGTEPETIADIPALAASVAAYAFVEGCQPKSCAILVMNFTLPNGQTSPYGLQLADRLSSELAHNDYKLRVIDRALLESLLAKYRISAQSMHRTVIRSIAVELNTRFMVVGTTEKLDDGTVRLSSKVVDATDKGWDGITQLSISVRRTRGKTSSQPTLFPLFLPSHPLRAARHSSGREATEPHIHSASIVPTRPFRKRLPNCACVGKSTRKWSLTHRAE